MLAEAENPRAVPGGNMPPEPIEPAVATPFEIAKKAVDDACDEARLWLDGNPIVDQATADGVGNLIRVILDAEKLADAARKSEKAELDTQIAAIQTKYAPLIADTKSTKGKTVLAVASCKAALEPWLTKVAAEQAEAARIAREVADAATKAAREALRASDATNLAEREEAEKLVTDAAKLTRVATRAEKQTATAGGTMGRAVGMRTHTVVTMTDPVLAARWAWAEHRDELTAFVQGLAEAAQKAGAAEISGFAITKGKTL